MTPRPYWTRAARAVLSALLPAVLIPAAAWILWQESGRAPKAAPAAVERQVAISAAALPGNGAVLGPFRLAGAAVLTGADKGLGGLSGLAGLPDGRLLAISDDGQWLVLRPVIENGLLTGVAEARMGPYASAGDKIDRDGEAVQLTPGGRTLISLEQRHRIVVLRGRGPPFAPEGTIWRTAAAGWPSNGGGEALAMLPDGAMLWISEQARRPDGAHIALFTTADGRTRSIGIPTLPGFSPTDAALLDGTRLLLLHRLYNGISNEAAISLVDLAPVIAGGDTAGQRELARWGRDGPWPVDNMEGLALVREPDGRRFVYLVSDDNFNPAQRTLLLRLEIIGAL